jgi:hypothetical protein
MLSETFASLYKEKTHAGMHAPDHNKSYFLLVEYGTSNLKFPAQWSF